MGWDWRKILLAWLNGLVELGSFWWWFLSSLAGFEWLAFASLKPKTLEVLGDIVSWKWQSNFQGRTTRLCVDVFFFFRFLVSGSKVCFIIIFFEGFGMETPFSVVKNAHLGRSPL